MTWQCKSKDDQPRNDPEKSVRSVKTALLTTLQGLRRPKNFRFAKNRELWIKTRNTKMSSRQAWRIM